MVAAYLGDGSPVGSRTVSYLLSAPLSAATIRNTMGELADLGLVDKPHPSAGRVPTETGLRIFVDRLLDPRLLGDYEKRALAESVDEADPESLLHATSQVLSERTRQLGFVVGPRLERVVLRHVSLVRLTSDRVLAVLVSRTGEAHRRVFWDRDAGDQAELDRIAVALSERVTGHTLAEVRELLAGELRALRDGANRLLRRAVELGQRALAAEAEEPADLVVATRLALLDQPEFHDPERIRSLLAVVEVRATLLRVVDSVLEALEPQGQGVRVAFGAELGEPGLRQCALVAAPYGDPHRPFGVLGVIGASRMDYARVIPVVGFLSELLTEHLTEQPGP